MINNKLEVKSIYNVIGTIYGKEEPDRYVLMGNHRDSWVFGAVDASSGTSTTTEVARGLGTLIKEGWRPRRTIKVWPIHVLWLLSSFQSCNFVLFVVFLFVFEPFISFSLILTIVRFVFSSSLSLFPLNYTFSVSFCSFQFVNVIILQVGSAAPT